MNTVNLRGTNLDATPVMVRHPSSVTREQLWTRQPPSADTWTARSTSPTCRATCSPSPTSSTSSACEVTGDLPAGLRGSFVRNGPNPMFQPIGRYHMFDGDGMLHGLTFDEGRVSYRNRWIRSSGPRAPRWRSAGRSIPGSATS